MSYDPASYSAGVEAAANVVRSRRHQINDAYSIGAAATKVLDEVETRIRALTPPAASQDSGEDDEMPMGDEGGSIAGNAPSRTGRCGSLVTSASPAPETTDVRERAQIAETIAAIISDKAFIDIHFSITNAAEIANAILDANLLRTPDIAATGGASADGQESRRPLLDDLWDANERQGQEISALRERAEKAERERDAAHRETGDLREGIAEAIGMPWIGNPAYGQRCPDDHDIIAAVTRLTEDLAARTKERDAIELDLRRQIIGWTETAGGHLCRAEKAEADRDALQQRVGALEEAAKELADEAQGIGQHLVYNAPTKNFASAIDKVRAILSQPTTPNAKTEGV